MTGWRLAELGEHDREIFVSFLDGLVTKTRLKALTAEIS